MPERDLSEHLHPRDTVSLVGGVLCLLVAVLFLLTDLTPLSVPVGVLVPVAVLAAGAAGTARGVRRLRARDRTPG